MVQIKNFFIILAVFLVSIGSVLAINITNSTTNETQNNFTITPQPTIQEPTPEPVDRTGWRTPENREEKQLEELTKAIGLSRNQPMNTRKQITQEYLNIMVQERENLRIQTERLNNGLERTNTTRVRRIDELPNQRVQEVHQELNERGVFNQRNNVLNLLFALEVNNVLREERRAVFLEKQEKGEIESELRNVAGRSLPTRVNQGVQFR